MTFQDVLRTGNLVPVNEALAECAKHGLPAQYDEARHAIVDASYDTMPAIAIERDGLVSGIAVLAWLGY